MQENIIHIEWSKGHMMLIIDRFFPCTVKDAKKIMPMIASGSSEEDIRKLEHYLDITIRDFKSAEDFLQEELDDGKVPARHVGRQKRQMASCRSMVKKADRNLAILEELL